METSDSRNQKAIQTLQATLTIVMLALIGFYISINKSNFEILRGISLTDIFILAFLYLFNVYFSASQNARLIQSLGIPLSNLESFGLSNVSALVGLVVPQGLTLTKAIYLKQRYALPYSKSPAWFLALLVVFLFIGSCIMAITNTLASLQGIKVPFILWIATIGGAMSTILFFFDIPQIISEKSGRFGRLMNNFSSGWKELRSNKANLVKVCIWQIAIYLCSGIQIAIAYRSLGMDINPLIGISLSVFIFFSTVVTVIPGNLGFQEALYGYFSYLSGLTFVQGVIAGALLRAVGLALTLILGSISWYFLFLQRGIKFR